MRRYSPYLSQLPAPKTCPRELPRHTRSGCSLSSRCGLEMNSHNYRVFSLPGHRLHRVLPSLARGLRRLSQSTSYLQRRRFWVCWKPVRRKGQRQQHLSWTKPYFTHRAEANRQTKVGTSCFILFFLAPRLISQRLQ